LKPGSVVCESGTGSGSSSHHFERCIAPSGHLHTFEFNQTRADMARAEFKRNGISENVTVTCTDVCKNGFGLKSEADAVFLDLPSPWVAVPHAAEALKLTGRVCSFSPCMEQVQKTCDALRKCGFDQVCTIETLLRPYQVQTFTCRGGAKTDVGTGSKVPVEGPKRRRLSRPESKMRGHTSFLTFATKCKEE